MPKSKIQQKNQPLPVAIADPQMLDLATYDEIAARAYEIFQARGGEHGADVDDWLQAEREVLQRHREH